MFRNFWQFIDDVLYLFGLVAAGSMAFVMVVILGWGLVQFLADLAGG